MLTVDIHAMAETGASHQQLRRWSAAGYLHAHDPAPGSGNSITWPAEEQRIAALIVQLRAAGFTVEAAAKVARAGGVHELAPGIKVEVAA